MEQINKRPRWRRWLLELVIVAVGIALIGLWQTRNLPEGEAPPVSGQLIDGSRFVLADAAAEGPMLLWFWGTWCPVCHANSGAIESVAADHPVVSVAMNSGGAADIRRHMAEESLAFPVLPDPDGAIAARYSVTGVPTAFIIDRQGRIRSTTVGYTPGVMLRLRLWLARVF